jgi:hypothetical protein
MMMLVTRRNGSAKHIRRNIRDREVISDWNKFLGPGKQTNVNPFSGKVDNNRIFTQQKDGTWKSIRMGPHEVRNAKDQHYHLEQWDTSGNLIRPDESVHILTTRGQLNAHRSNNSKAALHSNSQF